MPKPNNPALAVLASRGTPRSRDTTKAALLRLAEAMGGDNLETYPWNSLTGEAVRRALKRMEKQGHSVAWRNLALTSVKQVAKHAQANGRLPATALVEILAIKATPANQKSL